MKKLFSSHNDQYYYTSDEEEMLETDAGTSGMKAYEDFLESYSYLKGFEDRAWKDPYFLVNLLGIDALRNIDHLEPLGDDIVSYYLTLCDECAMWLRGFRACRSQGESSLYPEDIFVATPNGYVDISQAASDMKMAVDESGKPRNENPQTESPKEKDRIKEATLNSAKVDAVRKGLVRWFTKNNLWKQQHQERCAVLRDLSKRVLPHVKPESRSEGDRERDMENIQADLTFAATGKTADTIHMTNSQKIKHMTTLPSLQNRESDNNTVASHANSQGRLPSYANGVSTSQRIPLKNRGSLREASTESTEIKPRGDESDVFSNGTFGDTGKPRSRLNSINMLFVDSKADVDENLNPSMAIAEEKSSSRRFPIRRHDEVVVVCSDSNEKRLRCLYEWLEKESQALKIIEQAFVRLKRKPQHKNSEWRDDSFSVIARVRDICPGLQLEMPPIKNYLIAAGYPQYSEVNKVRHPLDRRKNPHLREPQKNDSLEEGGDKSCYSDMGLYEGLIKQVKDGKQMKTIFEPFPWFSFDPRSESSSYSVIDDALIFRDAPIPR